jgi:4-amino-4-deoxy-L-arabinose transferase-like glycosyltransferase
MNGSVERTEAAPEIGLGKTLLSPTPRQFFVLLLIYFGLHTLLRGLVSETAGIDDADQLVRAQIWSWGYGPQPPLYTWLLKSFLTVFGYNIYAVTALKELALFGIYVLAYANARLLTRSHFCAIAAAVAIQFNPSISWESHRELTHSILTSFFVLATLFCFLRLKSGSWKFYLLFGSAAALGTLSKPNYLIFLGGLLLAGISLKEKRPLVLHRKMIVALLLTGFLCAPHLHWVWEHQELALSSMHKFKMDGAESWSAAMAKALPKWVTNLLAHLGPTLAVFALLFQKAFPKPKCLTPEDRLLWRTLLFILSIVTLSILLFKVTGFRDRWLQPLFVWIPILLIALLRDSLSIVRYKRILLLGALTSAVVLVAAPGRLLVTEKLKKNEILNSPYRGLAKELEPILEHADVIIVGDYRIAGNLRLWFPNKFITSPEFVDLFPRASGRTVIIWDNPEGGTVPVGLLQFVESVTGKSGGIDVRNVKATLKYHSTRSMELGVAMMH